MHLGECGGELIIVVSINVSRKINCFSEFIDLFTSLLKLCIVTARSGGTGQ